MFSKFELQEKGFFPKGKYVWGKSFPKDFNLPSSVVHEDFQKLPLYVKVHYEYYATNNIHKLKKLVEAEKENTNV